MRLLPQQVQQQKQQQGSSVRSATMHTTLPCSEAAVLAQVMVAVMAVMAPRRVLQAMMLRACIMLTSISWGSSSSAAYGHTSRR
jgi:hypothetical protein